MSFVQRTDLRQPATPPINWQSSIYCSRFNHLLVNNYHWVLFLQHSSLLNNKNLCVHQQNHSRRRGINPCTHTCTMGSRVSGCVAGSSRLAIPLYTMRVAQHLSVLNNVHPGQSLNSKIMQCNLVRVYLVVRLLVDTYRTVVQKQHGRTEWVPTCKNTNTISK